MLVHTAEVRGRRISVRPREVVQHGVNSDAVALDADAEWDGFDRVTVVMSKGGASTAIPYAGEPVPIPFELMEEPGAIYLTAIGRTGSDVRVVTARMPLPLTVVESGSVDGSYEPGDPALDEVQQAIEDARAAAGRADEAAERAGSLPSISCGEGDPSLGNNEGDLYIDSGSGALWKYESV